MTTLRKLIITGATGKQGGALITALLSTYPKTFDIYAITRNPTSPTAQRLSAQGITIIRGDFDQPKEVFSQISDPWGLFSVTMPLGGAKKEEAQGKAMTRAALDAGVKHIVFTATERGGSETDPTVVPHFASKFNIEKDIEEKAAKKGATWTFLRPVAFYENLAPGFLGKAFVSMWRLNGPENRVQFISTKDIGKVAADAFVNAEEPEYRNTAISLAGDEITPNEMAKVFKEVTGEELPATYPFVGRILRWMLWEQLGIMFKWFVDVGFKTDISATKKRYPFLKDFRGWLESESAWAKKAA